MYPMVPGVFIILQMWKASVRRTSQAEKDSCRWFQLQWYVLVTFFATALNENGTISGIIQPFVPGVIKLTF